MHVSHIFEDLAAVVPSFSHAERVATVFRPTVKVAVGHADRARRGRRTSRRRATTSATTGASTRSGTAPRSRPPRGSRRTYAGRTGRVYPKGTAIPQRADFNTLDNPFFWSAHPDARRHDRRAPPPGVHFVVFNPTSDDFHRNRLAMDGVMPDGTKLPLDAERVAARASTPC